MIRLVVRRDVDGGVEKAREKALPVEGGWGEDTDVITSD